LPAIRGADEVVSEGNLPPNWQAFLDAREIGMALFATQTRVPGLTQDIDTMLDELWLKGGDVKATLQKVGEMVNKKLQSATKS
jgi:multiple sugar transport system substrate-binding protein